MSPEVPVILLILAIPVYFFSKWILGILKFGNNENRKYLAIIPAVILSPVLYVGIILIWICSISYYPQTAFNPQEWNEKPDERYKMSFDIIKREILIGKTKVEVIELLGENFDTYNENHIVYYLGLLPGSFAPCPDILEIYFENGKVIKVRQRTT